MMDITKLFKACVKTAEMRKGRKQPNLVENRTKDRDRASFNAKATDVVRSISKLKDFLLKNNKDYISEFSHITLDASPFTEEDRNQIDADAQSFITACAAAINLLRKEASKLDKDGQPSSHQQGVVALLQSYLKAVCGLYSQQRAIRVKQTVDRRRLSRLNPERRSANPTSHGDNLPQLRKRIKTTESVIATEKPKEELSVSKEKTVAFTSIRPEKPRDSVISPEETQMLELENKRLYEEMNNIVDEVKQIEGKVIEISQLQEVFSEKVLNQAEQVENIHDVAISTTENVKEGNENIREAIQNSASFRAYLLFILVMCTLSLLLLDWFSK